MNVIQKIGRKTAKKPEAKPMPYYNCDDAVEMIRAKTGLDVNIINKVLWAEECYMASVGIIDQVYWPEEYWK